MKMDGEQERSVHRQDRRILWCYVITGAFGLACGLGGIAVDVVNNYSYGITEGPVVAWASVLFAGGLAVIPAIAQSEGWTPALRALLALCFIITGFCALNAYAADIGAKINKAESASTTYQDARKALEDARAEVIAARAEAQQAHQEAAAVVEKTPSAELQALADNADRKAKAEASDPKRGAFCGNTCRAVERDRDEFLRRKGEAVAKEAALGRAQAAEERAGKAQERVDQARGESKAGKAEVSMLTTLIAGQIGGEPGDIARMIALGKTVLFIVGTLLFAAPVDRSLYMVVKGFAGAPIPGTPVPVQTEAKIIAPAVRRTKSVKPVKLTPVRKVVSATGEEQIARFVRECLRTGAANAEVTSAQLFQAFDVWWSRNAKGQPMPTQTALGRTLKAEGIVSGKRGGKMRYPGVELVS
jgi:hypothetical protein